MSHSEHALILPPAVTEESICLPLSINAVSKYWNIDLPLAEAINISKMYPGANGSILMEGIELAERHGLRSLILNSSLTELKKIIDMGIPPIVILPGVFGTVQHASVISGYDNEEKTIIHYIPKPDQIGAIPEQQFNKLWSEDGRLMLLLGPPEIISSVKPNNISSEKSNRLCFIAEKLNLQNKKEHALRNLEHAIKIDKNNSTAYCIYGGILNSQNSSDCIYYYENSIVVNKECYLAYRGLGNYYLKIKNYNKAEYYYNEAIKINPNRFGPIYKNRGIAKLEQEKNQEAKLDFNTYLKQTPNAKDEKNILQVIQEL